MNSGLQPALNAVIESLQKMDDDDFEKLGLAVSEEADRRLQKGIEELSKSWAK